MVERTIKHEGPGFVIYTKDSPVRAGVLRTYRRLSGHSGSASLMVRYTHADQLADYLAKRIWVTTLLARYTLYYRFVWEPDPASVYVSGAAVQIGTGTSGQPTRDAEGCTLYNGLDASHVRLGTYSVNGEPVSKLWPRRVFQLAAHRGVPRALIPETFPANTTMASVAMMYDAVTDYTDALLNRVFGKIEDDSHRAMRTLIPAVTPANLAELEQYQIRFSENFPFLIARMIKRYARERLVRLRSPATREARQAPGVDGSPPMFASETEILRALIAQLDEPASELASQLNDMVARSRRDIMDEVADASAARQEVA